MLKPTKGGDRVLYGGVEINEARLLTHNILFSLMLVILLAVAVVAFLTFRSKKDPKTQNRIARLKQRSETDSKAKKQLEKLERKQSRRVKDSLGIKLLVFSLLAVLIFLNVFVALIPGWTDYVKKDYIVYDGELSGEYEVKRYIRDSTIFLPDGTKISGALGLDDGMHTEIIIYSKRTKIALGRESGE